MTESARLCTKTPDGNYTRSAAASYESSESDAKFTTPFLSRNDFIGAVKSIFDLKNLGLCIACFCCC